MTVKRNAQWWGENGPLAYGRRIRFDGSRLVWQSYPGQGVQIQWLGTFGRMNQLFLAKGYDTEVGAMAREIESYAVKPGRREGLGVPVRLRRRAPAVGQRARAGHRHPGAVARGRAPEGPALVRRRPQRAGRLPQPAAVGRAREGQGGRALPRLLLRPGAADLQRLPAVGHRPARLRDLRQRPARAPPVPRRRAARARGDPRRGHRLVVALPAGRRLRHGLPQGPARLHARAVLAAERRPPARGDRACASAGATPGPSWAPSTATPTRPRSASPSSASTATSTRG